MGHSQVPDQNNALYGFKTDLKEQFRNGDRPRWLEKNDRALPSEWADKLLSEIIDLAAERARERRENVGDRLSDREFTRQVELKIDKRRAPDKIVKKMGVSREDAQEYTGFHRVNGRDYRLQIDVGVRGGIADISIVRDFHH